MGDHIAKAVKILKDGGIIIYPTDTAFGIGCRIDRPESVDRLFRMRKRSLNHAMPVLVDSNEMALAYLDHPKDIVRRLMDKYWPGGLTIIAPCKTYRIYSPIRGGGKTVGVRMPDHETTLTLIHGVGVPILGPSANFHGNPTSYTYESLDPELVKLVDYVVPGKCTIKQASTVIDMTTEPITIVRQGAVVVSEEMIYFK